jgi:hypothetical protein
MASFNLVMFLQRQVEHTDLRFDAILFWRWACVGYSVQRQIA